VTNLGLLRSGDEVNLERALRTGDPIGGHVVNGHVDGLGVVLSVSRNPYRLEISVAREISTYVVPKGSIAVNGVSLTVGPGEPAGRFEVFIIPHTWEATNLKRLRVGSKVNIEVDIFGKYVVNYLKESQRSD
jgi:riboflavin synthase alpha subunit